MSKEMSYQGRLVNVVERKGGWSTILDGMKQIKVRNTELSTPISGKANVPAKPGPLRARPASYNAKKADREATSKTPKANKSKKSDGDDGRLVKPDLAKYVVSAEVKTASGRKAIDTADAVAVQLRGADLADVYKQASTATGLTQKALHERYDHLNPGMQRMNLGNLLRGAASKAAREAEKAAKAK